MTAFPALLDSFTNPTPSSRQSVLSHAAQHDLLNDATLAIEKLLVGGAINNVIGLGVPSDGSDGGPLLNAAITATNNLGGGDLYIPPGHKISYSTPILFDGVNNVRLIGGGPVKGNGSADSCLEYTGGVGGRTVNDLVLNSSTTITSASANFANADIGSIVKVTGGGDGVVSADFYTTIVSVTNATTAIVHTTAPSAGAGLTALITDAPAMRITNGSWLEFVRVNFRYSNALFNGPVINSQKKTAGAAIPGHVWFTGCRIGGTSTAKSSLTLMEMGSTLDLVVDKCLLEYGVRGIRCNGDYYHIVRPTFGTDSTALTGPGIINGGQGCEIESPVSVGVSSGGGLIAGLLDCDLDSGIRSIYVKGGALEDTAGSAGTWFRFRGADLTIHGLGVASSASNLIQMIGGPGSQCNLNVVGGKPFGNVDFAVGAISGKATFVGADMSAASNTFTNLANIGNKLYIVGCPGIADCIPARTKSGADFSDADFIAPQSGLEGFRTDDFTHQARFGATWKKSAAYA